MSMLNLPNELFVPIIESVVRDLGRDKATKLRLVCKTFAVCIATTIDNDLLSMDLSELIDHGRHYKYFDNQSGRILGRKLLESSEQNPVLDFIKAVTNRFIAITKPSGEEARTQIMYHVCQAMMGLDPRALRENILDIRARVVRQPNSGGLFGAIAASVGDMQTCSRAIQKLDTLFESGNELFPSALNASVATGNLEVLRGLLSFIDTQIKDMPAARNWKPMRKTARYIGKALTVAIRLHNNAAGIILFDFMDENMALRNSRSSELGTYLFQDAVRSTNTTLLYRALSLDSYAPVAQRDPEQSFHYELDQDQIGFLFTCNNTTVLSMLLRDGHIQPDDDINGYTLLAYALKIHRRRIAQTLLDHGADINGLSVQDGVTALWYATKEGYSTDVLFLFNSGADPKYPDTPETSPHHLVQDRYYDYQKTKWLFKHAIAEHKFLRDHKFFEDPADDIEDAYNNENWGRSFW